MDLLRAATQAGVTALKRFLSAFLLALLVTPAQAGPKHWIAHHKRFLFAAGAIAGASIVQWKGASYCRRGDLERCSMAYGSSHAFDFVATSVSVGMLGVAVACWKNGGGK